MRPYATSVCGLTLLVCEALRHFTTPLYYSVAFLEAVRPHVLQACLDLGAARWQVPVETYV
jgi:hypothetical protein